MTLHRTRVHIFKDSSDLSSLGKCGVSMHCHSENSKEMLDFIPFYAEKMPIVSYFWKRESANYRRREGKEIDFSTSYWAPPLTARSVYDSEKKQINDAGLEAIVSLTDHDSIDGSLQLNAATDNTVSPISLEWTVPFEIGFFHLGVHNLPPDRAVELTRALLDFTLNEENHTNSNLSEMLSMLNEIPGVLVIFNHPIWDIEMIGKDAHELLLKDFLRLHGRWLHALEVNGFRSWSENKAVIDLAESLGMPVVSGGDRHGCKPNTVINVTKTATFEEFVEEIRIEKRSEVAVMPAYEQPLHSRQLQSFSEILSNYPDFPESRRRWFDRIFFDTGDGKGLVPLSAHGWQRGGPVWLRGLINTLNFLGSPTMQPLFRALRKKEDRVPFKIETKNAGRQEYDKLSPTLSSGTV